MLLRDDYRTSAFRRMLRNKIWNSIRKYSLQICKIDVREKYGKTMKSPI